MEKQQRAKTSIAIDATQVAPGDVDAAILAAVRGIRFGSVEIVIHGSKVVQIESKERIRFVPRQDGSKH